MILIILHNSPVELFLFGYRRIILYLCIVCLFRLSTTAWCVYFIDSLTSGWGLQFKADNERLSG